MICTLCPRRCGAERTETEGAGICRMPAAPVVARAALHRWEEPPISGTRGSGTIFFSGCSLRCVFCQNEQISHANYGKPVSLERLREICRELIGQEAHNINLVNPTHYAHVISDLLDQPLPVPVVWNTGGYDRTDTLLALEGKIDIYLPDLKYVRPGAGGALLRRAGLSGGGKGGHPGDVPADRPLPIRQRWDHDPGGHHPASGAAGTGGGGQGGDGLGEGHLCPGSWSSSP